MMGKDFRENLKLLHELDNHIGKSEAMSGQERLIAISFMTRISDSTDMAFSKLRLDCRVGGTKLSSRRHREHR